MLVVLSMVWLMRGHLDGHPADVDRTRFARHFVEIGPLGFGWLDGCRYRRPALGVGQLGLGRSPDKYRRQPVQRPQSQSAGDRLGRLAAQPLASRWRAVSGSGGARPLPGRRTDRVGPGCPRFSGRRAAKRARPSCPGREGAGAAKRAWSCRPSRAGAGAADRAWSCRRSRAGASAADRARPSPSSRAGASRAAPGATGRAIVRTRTASAGRGPTRTGEPRVRTGA